MAEVHRVDWNVLEGRLQRLHERAVDVMSRELGFDKPPYCKVEVLPEKIGAICCVPPIILLGGHEIKNWAEGNEGAYNPFLNLLQMVREREFTLLHETGHHFRHIYGPKKELDRFMYLHEKVRNKMSAEEDEEFDRLIGANELIAEIFALNYLDITRGERFFKELTGANKLKCDGTYWKIPRNADFLVYNEIKELKRRKEIVKQCITQRYEEIEQISELQRYFRYVNSLATK